ncbi:hypothetical protein [Calothrix sp. NIES-2098]|uniref:hypothetical protein n=1 Tax=Calothrix sp. NIES-2098 TaxID=1954171 RepID=UPI0030DD933E
MAKNKLILNEWLEFWVLAKARTPISPAYFNLNKCHEASTSYRLIQTEFVTNILHH